jgi:hypothetical protein
LTDSRFRYAGPGGFNDPDMLLGSSGGSAVKLTPLQSRAQFSLWSVMAAPLLIGANLAQLSSYDLETYTNAEVLRVSQVGADPFQLECFANCFRRIRWAGRACALPGAI